MASWMVSRRRIRGNTLIFSFMTPFRFHYTVRLHDDPHSRTHKYKNSRYFSAFDSVKFLFHSVGHVWAVFRWFVDAELGVCLCYVSGWQKRDYGVSQCWCLTQHRNERISMPSVGRLSHVTVVFIAASWRGPRPVATVKWLLIFFRCTWHGWTWCDRFIIVSTLNHHNSLVFKTTMNHAHHSSCCLLYLHP